MKTFLCFFLLPFIYLKSYAVDYYSRGSFCPNILTNWDINQEGGGGVPGSFTNPGDRFIIQNGDTMITTAIWTIGGAGSALQIQNGAILQGDHVILLTGVFQIDNGGTYIHNNKGSVDETAGSSIFSGTELFAAKSHFEIRNWQSKNTGLPNESPGISWGDLIINLQSDISEDGSPWNWNIGDGATLTINGNLDIRSTYDRFATEIRLTSSGIQAINVWGHFLMSGYKTKVSVKSNSSPPLEGYTTMQVNGDVSLTDGAQLELGINTTFPNPYGLYELRFKGNYLSNGITSLLLFSSSRQSYLVANGVSPQSFFSTTWPGSNVRVAPGATVNLTSALTLMGSDQTLSILGTFNQNSYNMTVNGKIECAGGTFNASGNLTVGVSCTACSNLNGTYNSSDNTWCAASGVKGRINFKGSTISMNNTDSSSILTAGDTSIKSPGDIYFVNSTAFSLADISFIAAINVYENSILSLDANSYVAGSGTRYQGRGGVLRIGSADGITVAGNTTTGNIRAGLSKDYDFSGTNSFEYFGAGTQVTGSGLPASVAGVLKINNTAGPGTAGIILSRSTKVSGTLDLTSGKLTTSLQRLMTLDKGGWVNLPVWGASFVAGPMKKIGSASFSFPIGKGNNFAPLSLTGTGAATDEYIAEYFMANPVLMIGSAFDNPPIDHTSVLEWWTVDRSAGYTAKNVTLEATTYSDENLLSDLRIVRWDGAAWRNEGNTAYSGVSAGQVTSGIVSGFFTAGTTTPFTFGSVAHLVAPLLINLIWFDAIKLTNTKASIHWELAAFCSAAAQFEIEKSNGNSGFAKIAAVNGNEISHLYNYTDNDLKTGISYYRLKMTDENGKVAYSRTVAVMNGVNGLLLTSLIPNMVTNSTMLTVSSSRAQKLDLIIMDMQGRLMQKQNHTVAAGNTTIQVSTDHLAAGAYQLFGVSAEGKTNSIRFIKQ